MQYPYSDKRMKSHQFLCQAQHKGILKSAQDTKAQTGDKLPVVSASLEISPRPLPYLEHALPRLNTEGSSLL